MNDGQLMALLMAILWDKVPPAGNDAGRAANAWEAAEAITARLRQEIGGGRQGEGWL